MQCKDIPDRPILEFVNSFNGGWCYLLDVKFERDVRRAMPADVPWKLALAKMRTLMRRGLVDGCDCGCRGDFFLTEKGKDFLGESEGCYDATSVQD